MDFHSYYDRQRIIYGRIIRAPDHHVQIQGLVREFLHVQCTVGSARNLV